ncbi:MAG: ABC transporter ATP-binding protein [Planctomycetota bacterium]|nr:ABC transporter ATP-binding protein [Planctomycetota bacterium]
MTASSPLLEIDGLTKRYGDFTAVSDLSFACEPGEILGLVGPNGAGKTTSLRCVTGILKPSAGRIRVAGHDVATAPERAKRALAFIPDTPHPFDMLTVTEHLRFAALAYDVADPEARFAALLEELELTEKRDELASTLSRGMRQKLAIATAFLREPEVILFDEPLTGLDPKAIRMMRDSIRRRADAGAAVVISSHLLDLVERLCDRVLVLHRGQRRALGTLETIRAAAASHEDASLEEAFFAITEGHDLA